MKKALSIIVTLCLVLGLLPSAISVSASTDITASTDEQKVICAATLDDAFADDSVLVVVKHSASAINKEFKPEDFLPAEIAAVKDLSAFDREISEIEQFDITTFHQILKLTLKKSGKENVLETVKQLEKLDFLKSAEPNYLIEINDEPDLTQSVQTNFVDTADVLHSAESTAATPNDPFYDLQWYLEQINIADAWEYTTGSKSVKVGIIDVDFDTDHPDLKDNFSQSLVNFGDSDYNQSDPDTRHMHGTHVAGIVGAKGNNNIGVTGVCWDISMIPIRIGNIYDSIETEYIVNALQYATLNNFPIVNMSLTCSKDYSTTVLYDTINNYPGLLVVAAGNSIYPYINIDDTTDNGSYPSSYDCDNLLAVGSCTKTAIPYRGDPYTIMTEYSYYGPVSVDIFAPGGNNEFLPLPVDTTILSTIPSYNGIDSAGMTVYSSSSSNGRYGLAIGTSMATPLVTGVAALLKSYVPELTTQQLKEIILSNVDKTEYWLDKCVSGGTLNAGKALKAAATYKNEYILEDGLYTISNFGSSATLISAPNATAGQAPGYIDAYNQKFYFDYQYNGGYYYIRSIEDPSYVFTLDNLDNGSVVTMKEQRGNYYQKFRIGKTYNGRYRIYLYNDYYKELEIGELGGSNTLLFINDSYGTNYQIWSIHPYKPLQDSTYTIKNQTSGKMLTNLNGTPVQLYYANKNTQQWRFLYNEGYYEICPLNNTDLRLTAYGTPADGSAVTLEQSDGSDSQKWFVLRSSASNYTIYSKENVPSLKMSISSTKDFATTQLKNDGISWEVVSTTPSQIQAGDVNMDGIIANDDVSLIGNYVYNNGTLTSEQKQYADYNGDGVINSNDLMTLASYGPVQDRVTPGIYTMQTNRNVQYMLGTNLQQAADGSTIETSFIFDWIRDGSKGYYTIRPLNHPNYYVTAVSTSTGTKLSLQTESAGSAIQQFAIENTPFEMVIRPKGDLTKVVSGAASAGQVPEISVIEQSANYSWYTWSINSSSIQLGDVNTDGKINSADSLAVLKHIEGINSFVDSPTKLYLADVTQDGYIDRNDANRILELATNQS